MRNFLLLTTTKGSSLHRCTHQEVFLRTATTSGNDREAKAMVAVQIKSLSKCDSNPPLPTVSKRTTAMQQAATTRTPPCSSCHYTKTLQYILKIRSNGSKSLSQNSRKVSQTLSTRSPRQPPFLLFNTTTTTLPRMATKPSRPLKRTAKHTRRGSKRCEFLHAFDIRHC